MAFDRASFLASLNWRYAVKRFATDRKIPDADWHVLVETLRLSPSSYGLQPWHFIVVQNPELRKRLTPLSWNQKQVEDCSHFIVFTTLKTVTLEHVDRFIADTAHKRGLPVEKLAGYRKGIVSDLIDGARAKEIHSWTQRQAYIAMGNLMNAAALLGIDTCPMEGLEPAKYDEVLNLTSTDFATVAAVGLGYRHAEDKYQHMKKVRYSLEEIIEYR